MDKVIIIQAQVTKRLKKAYAASAIGDSWLGTAEYMVPDSPLLAALKVRSGVWAATVHKLVNAKS